MKLSLCTTAAAVAVAMGFAPNAIAFAAVRDSGDPDLTTAEGVARAHGMTPLEHDSTTTAAVRLYMDGIRTRAGAAGVVLAPMNGPRGTSQEVDDVVALSDEDLDNNQSRFANLIERINNDASGRRLTDREEDRIADAQEGLAVVQAEIDRRARPAGRRSQPDGMAASADRQQNQTRAQRDAQQQRQGGQQRASLPAVPRSAQSSTGGFRDEVEFWGAVISGSGKGAVPDNRLVFNAAPTSFGSEGVGADGGFAVPPDFRSEIIAKVLGEESLLAMTDQQTSSSNSITFPADETTPWQSSGGIQAYWEIEGGQKTTSKPQLTEKTVKLNKLIALVPMTDELLEDSAAMAGYVSRKAPEKLDFRVSDAILNGTGVGQPLGILTSPGTVVVAKESGQAADTVVFANIVKLWSAVTPRARRNAKWFLHPDVESQLMGMQFPGTGTAVPAYLPPGGLASAPYGTLMGRPIVYNEASQALGDQGDIMFGDLRNYLSVVKSGGVRQDVSIHVWFDYDITAFRFVMRVGGQPWWNSPITGFQAGSSTRGFFATLAARA